MNLIILLKKIWAFAYHCCHDSEGWHPRDCTLVMDSRLRGNDIELYNPTKILSIFFYALTLLLLALTIGGCTDKPPAHEAKAPFVLSETMFQSMSTATVTYDSLRSELKFYGKITVDNNKLIEVYPVVGGNVQQVNVALGDYVKKGQLLATIRSTEVAGFEKELKDAQSDVIVANNNLRVAQELFAGKLNAEKDVLEAKSLHEKAESQLKRIQETFKIYNMKSGAIYQVLAPINGFIVEKKINQDILLRSDRSDNIFDIAEINEVSVIANVNEVDIAEIQLGMDAFVTALSYPDKVFHGNVDKIYNIIDPETKAMKIGIKLSNVGFLLKPEMRASVRITHTDSKQMLSIPSKAVIFDKSKYFVMVFKDREHIETRQVEIFKHAGDITYIRSGVAQGETIITQNQLLIYDALND